MSSLRIGARTASRPRLDAYIGSDRLPGVIEIQVTQNVTQNSDSFQVTLSLSQLEKRSPAYGWAYWASIDKVIMDLWFGFADDEAGRQEAARQKPVPFFTGFADSIRIDPVRDVVSISGRDGSALLIQSKISKKYPNKKASEIATELAQEHDLLPEVTETDGSSGLVYKDDHVHLASDRNAWELLTSLAQQQGFETYVRGRTLYFGPKPPSSAPFLVTWKRDGGTGPACTVVTLAASRNLIAAKGIKVTVNSWNAKLGRSVTATSAAGKAAGAEPHAKGRGTGTGRLNGGPQLYVFNPPGLDQAGAQRYADEQLRLLSQHELRLDLSMGAEMTLDHHSVLRLQGTGTAFDQLYYPEEIQRVQSYERGFTTTVRAKNHDTSRVQILSGGAV